MEPLSALSLFCNILDISDRTIKICRECSEIYRSLGGRRTHDQELLGYLGELQEILHNFSSSTSRLHKHDSHKSITAPLGRMKTKITAAIDIMDEFRAKKPGSLVATAMATIRVARRQGILDGILKELKQNRDDVHFAIAQDTRVQIEEISARANRLSEGQVEILSRLKRLDAGLNRLNINVSKVPDLVIKAKEVAQGVHTELCALSILARLGNTNERYWNVPDADSHTFNWILQDDEDDDSTAQEQRDVNERLRTWLLGGNGLFHVSGKPGSGKSTLMKYLVQHPRVTSSLEEWAHPKHLAFGRFFFWKPDYQQNSLEALLRGLLHSIIYHDAQLVHSAFPTCTNDSFEYLALKSKSEMTKQEILEAFNNLIRNSSVSEHFKFCFFVDGLDELVEENDTTYSTVVTMLRQWTRGPTSSVKICVSSRPFPVFQNMPVGHRIRLQDLTRGDIAAFVQHNLCSHHAFRAEMKIDPFTCQQLIDTVIWNAQGVFLWVSLVVRSVERGLSNADSISVLRERVERTPRGLEKLIESLLNDIEECHAQMVVLLLAIITACIPTIPKPRRKPAYFDTSLSACRNFFRAQETSPSSNIDDIFSPRNFPEPWELTAETVTSTTSMILFRCKGLLEVIPAAPINEDSYWQDYCGGTVTFIHRSIPEYLETWIPKEMDAHELRLSHVQKAMSWMLWAEIEFLNSSVNPRHFLKSHQRGIRYHIKHMARETMASFRAGATLLSCPSAAFQLLDLAEDASRSSASISAHHETQNHESPRAYTWNTLVFDKRPPDPLLPPTCPSFVSPLVAAAEVGVHEYVRWRLAKTSPPSRYSDYFQHCLEGVLVGISGSQMVFQPFVEGRIEDYAQISQSLIQMTDADINSTPLGCCSKPLPSSHESSSLPSVFDTLWLLFLLHRHYSTIEFQNDVFAMIESLLVLGARPRTALIFGEAGKWFGVPGTSDYLPCGIQVDDIHEIPGIQCWSCPETHENLRRIYGREGGLITLETLVVHLMPPNAAAILTLIERTWPAEDGELNLTDHCYAAVRGKGGARRIAKLIWLDERGGWS